MAESQEFAPGSIVWQDLTVDNAEEISRFYERVVGWERSVHPGIEDFNMSIPGEETPTAGVCYAAGTNAGVPPHWIIYVSVSDVNEAIRNAEEAGGKLVDGPRYVGNHLFCIVQDPAGAYIGLISSTAVKPVNETSTEKSPE